jgi:hypothetical protein
VVGDGAMKAEEAWCFAPDVQTKRAIALGMGSVRWWNAYRKRYVMIAGELGGSTSMLRRDLV